MSHRTTIKTILRSVALGVATLPLAIAVFGASDTKGLVPLSLQGVSGNGILAGGSCVNPAITCKTGDECSCLTTTYSLVGNQGFKGGNFSLQLSIDTSVVNLPIGETESCSPATGNGILSSSNGKQGVIMKISGLECPSVSANAPDVFNLTYVVTGGSGKYSLASGGTGTVNGSQVNPNGTGQVLIAGSLQPVAPITIATSTPTPTPSGSPTATPSETPTSTPSETPTATPSETPSPSPS